MVGNIPGVSSIEDAKTWLDTHCRSVESVGIVSPGPSDVYKKGSGSNVVFVKCRSESHREKVHSKYPGGVKETTRFFPNAGDYITDFRKSRFAF